MKTKMIILIITSLIALASLNASHTISTNFETPVVVKTSDNILYLETSLKNFEVIVFDYQGNYMNWNMNRNEIDITDLTPGTYRLHIRNIETGEVYWDEFSK